MHTTKNISSNRRLITIGLVLAIPIALLQGINVVRAVVDPAGFAEYMGLPLANQHDVMWVSIYALRTSFIAFIVIALVASRNVASLKWAALVGMALPLGDAILTTANGAATSVIWRHIMIAGYVALTAVVLSMANRGSQ